MKLNTTQKSILAGITLLAALLSYTQAEPLTILTSGNRLLTIDSGTPNAVTKTVTVTGLGVGELLLAIDFRPATGELFALGNSSRVYSINPETGVATAIGAAGAFTLNGTSFGFDFNPTVDRIRITSNAEQNIRVDPNTGNAVVDTPLAYGPTDPNNGNNPNIVGSAYTNNFGGAVVTVLYSIDAAQDVLVVQESPNNGLLKTVGSIGGPFATTDNVSFDVSGTTGEAWAALTTFGDPSPSLYSMNLLTGMAVPRGVPNPFIAPNDLGGEIVVGLAANVNPGSRLANISSRGRVGTGQDVLIAGFITKGGVNSRIVLRAIGPSLGTQGIAGPLADPVLTLYDKNGNLLATNDDWKLTQQTSIAATGLAPADDLEAAILTRLAPDSYTAIVSGKANNVGVAVVEVYQLQ